MLTVDDDGDDGAVRGDEKDRRKTNSRQEHIEDGPPLIEQVAATECPVMTDLHLIKPVSYYQYIVLRLI